jgi:hypothetical protein
VSQSDLPKLLSRSAEPKQPFSSLRDAATIQQIHRQWEQLGAHTHRLFSPFGLVRSLRQSRQNAITQRQLLASLIQAIDALAQRTDEIARNLNELEHLVAEVVQVTSNDLIAIRAAKQSS